MNVTCATLLYLYIDGFDLLIFYRGFFFSSMLIRSMVWKFLSFFSCNVFVRFWYLVDADLIKWVGKYSVLLYFLKEYVHNSHFIFQMFDKILQSNSLVLEMFVHLFVEGFGLKIQFILYSIILFLYILFHLESVLVSLFSSENLSVSRL